MNAFGLAASGLLVCLGLVSSGCAGQESPTGDTRADGGGGRDGGHGGGGGRDGGDARDGGVGGSNVQCLDASRSLAPRCGEACTNPCGCRSCNVGDREGNLVCTRPGCYVPLHDGGGECTSPAASFDCTDGYAEGDGGVCGKTVSAAICVNGAFECPIGTIPTSRCTAQKCPSALPHGSCRGNESFSCVGWVYPFVSVSCLCISGTWSCQL